MIRSSELLVPIANHHYTIFCCCCCCCLPVLVAGQTVVAMFGYMTDLDAVEVDEALTEDFEVSGEDLPSLLFNLLDEFLFRFSTEPFQVKQ